MKSFLLVLFIVILIVGCAPQQPLQPPVSAPITPPESNESALSSSFATGPYEISAEEVSYGNSAGYFASPVADGIYPGVVMIHEWWGLNDNIKQMARTLASHGYRVLAVDLYGGKVAATADEARQLVSSVNPNQSVATMRSAVTYLKEQGSSKVASLGWCFGGGQSLALAMNEPLDATILYYGTPLVTDKQKLNSINWPVLGIFGDKDQAIPVASVNSFNESLSQLGIEHDIRIYPDVGHAFANPSAAAYAADSALDAWNRTLVFLDSTLNN